jgi:hypothetical protein
MMRLNRNVKDVVAFAIYLNSSNVSVSYGNCARRGMVVQKVRCEGGGDSVVVANVTTPGHSSCLTFRQTGRDRSPSAAPRSSVREPSLALRTGLRSTYKK